MERRNRSLQERITGRYLCYDIVDKDGNVLVKKNHMVTPKRAELICKKGVNENGEPLTQIKIRTNPYMSLTQWRMCKMLWSQHGNR